MQSYLTRTEIHGNSNTSRDAILSRPPPSLGWKMLADQMGRYYPARNHVELCPMPDPFLWIAKWPEIETVIHYLNVVMIHELAHWAGEEHVDDDEGWKWNLNIERIVLGKRMPVKKRASA